MTQTSRSDARGSRRTRRTPATAAATLLLGVGLAASSPKAGQVDPPAPAPGAPGGATLGPWLGRWTGPATLHHPGRAEVSQSFAMELRIAATDDPASFDWTIVYITPGTGDAPAQRQERAYRLVALDAAAGRFEIDERNGIVIPATLMGSAFYSCFTVQGSQITASYRLTPEAKIELELVTTDALRPSTTGDQDGVPPVVVLQPKAVQRAVLVRQP